MRLVLLTTSYPEDPYDASGHFVRAEARALARQGHEVHVVGAAPWGGDAGVRVHGCGGRALLGWPGAAARLRQSPARLLAAGPFAARAWAAIEAIGPERVVAHWAVPCGWPLGAAAGRPLSLVSHGADVRLLLGLPAAVRARVVATLLDRLEPVGAGEEDSRADGGPVSVARGWRFVAAQTREGLREALPAALGARLMERSWVEPPLVDVDERAAPPDVALPPGPRAVVAARLVASKRVELAIEAVARTAPWTLVVAGDGPERGRLEALARRAAPGRVAFVGRLPRPGALGLLAGADVLLHPSGAEAAPTTVREALLLGVPVVACAAGDIERWAREEPALAIVEPRAEALGQGLLRLGSRAGLAGRQRPSCGGRLVIWEFHRYLYGTSWWMRARAVGRPLRRGQNVISTAPTERLAGPW